MWACFTKIGICFANNQIRYSLSVDNQPYSAFIISLNERSTKKRVLSSDIALYNKVEFIRLMNMNQTRAEARTFTTHICNCVIINIFNDYAGLENMS